MKHARRISALAAAVVALTACAGAPGAAPTPQPVALKVAILPFLAFAPYWLAQDEGYFKEQNLDVELIDFTQQQDAVPSLVSGQIDVGSGNLSTGMFNAIARGGNLKLVSDKGYIDPGGCSNNAVIARKGVFPSATPAAQDLKGKTLSVVRGSWLEYYLDKLLADRGVKAADFNINYVQPAASLDALNSAAIDLAVTNEPWVTRMKNAGHVALLPESSVLMPGAQSAVMVFGPKLLGANADVGKRFMAAYLKGVRKYNEGKTDANVKALGKYAKLDEATVKAMCWPQLRNDGALDVKSTLDFQQWGVDKKLIDKALGEAEFYDQSALKAANAALGSK